LWLIGFWGGGGGAGGPGRGVVRGRGGRFWNAILAGWGRRDVGRVYVQHFDSALACWHGAGAALCIHQETCGQAMALMPNGDVYSCDHYVEPAYLLGNIMRDSLVEIAASPKQVAFGLDKRDGLPRYCRECSVRFACQGECPKSRFLTTPEGEAGRIYLWAGSKRVFGDLVRRVRMVLAWVREGRAAGEGMGMLAEQDRQRRMGMPTRARAAWEAGRG